MNIFVKNNKKNNFNNTLTQLKMSAFPQISFLLGEKRCWLNVHKLVSGPLKGKFNILANLPISMISIIIWINTVPLIFIACTFTKLWNNNGPQWLYMVIS